MVGGIEVALEAGAKELAALAVARADSAVAVDLGAGFGMHAIPLARLGYRVLAIDSCRELLDTLTGNEGELPIDVVEDDLLAFRKHLEAKADLALCMGDTLTHLPDERAVQTLVSEVAAALNRGGRFIATFRDYSVPLAAEKRFIPVRSDEQRLLTCFLEYGDTHVMVHDLLHERTGAQWELRVSSYPKLRLKPEKVVSLFEANGFEVRREPGLRGMVRIVARRL
jgi:SAM-dependent methyltransferase